MLQYNFLRLETAAGIVKYEKDGASIVGMTGMPEASFSQGS